MRRALVPLLLLLAPLAARADVPPLLAPPPPPPGLSPPPPPPAHGWSGYAGAGLILLTGNTNTGTVTGAGGVQWHSPEWIFAAKATGTYGRSSPADRSQPEQTVAAAATSLVRVDRRFGPHFTLFGMAGGETDHVASLELRGYGDAGVGYVWFDQKEAGGRELFLRTDLGGRYAYDARRQFYATAAAPVGDLPDLQLVAPRAGVSFRYAFSKAVALAEDAEALIDVAGHDRYLGKSVTKLVSRLNSWLTFGLGYTIAHDSRPAPGKVQTDTALGLTLETTF